MEEKSITSIDAAAPQSALGMSVTSPSFAASATGGPKPMLVSTEPYKAYLAPKRVTIDIILDFLKEAVENKQPLPPSAWLDSATKLMVLMEDLDDEWINSKMEVAELKAEYMGEGDTAAKAKCKVEATAAYRTWLILDRKRDRILEYVLLCKKRVNLKDWQ